MATIEPLSATRLHAKCDPGKIPWDDSSQISLGQTGSRQKNVFQPRAMQALDLALKIRVSGYNVYVSGDPGLGRTHTVLSYLRPIARRGAAPRDLIYVYNFLNPDSPRLYSLPQGTGKRVRELVAEAVQTFCKKLSSRFDNATYAKKHATLVDDFQKLRVDILHQMNDEAQTRGFHLEIDDNGGLSLTPMSDGKRLTDEDYEKLDSSMRFDLKRRGDNLAQSMSGMMRELTKAEENFHENERDLDRLVTSELLDEYCAPNFQKCIDLTQAEGLKEFFSLLRADILKNIEVILQKETAGPPEPPRLPVAEEILSHYAVNVFVDHTETVGAPIVVDEHPTAVNLLGCVERESELGALVTNFTLIRAGSLHRANGGFLVLHIDDLLQYPNAWEGLLRALRSGEIRIEDIDDVADSTIKTKSISPEALTLDLKVILVGSELLYETILETDGRFGKLFRIKAHLAGVVARTAPNIRRYLIEIARIIQEDQLLSFDRTALAWLVDHGCHLSEDQKRLSLQFPYLRELMIEACALAEMKGLTMVKGEILEEAYAARTYRVNLVEEEFLEEYDREMIKVRTKGQAIGQVNGLSVTMYGDFEFGLPHRISCTVGVGQEGIIDLEREAELGGPIHTKAMMILKSFLIKHFARKKPLVLSGSLYFEQNYAEIEGDSASGAELVALLSALAEVPVRHDLAFTGAVSHTGQILPVGGVSRKIEGFFKVCAHHGGLTGTQGVLIPRDNVDHLMLAPEVLEAVNEQKFFVYPVRTIEEALQLLTGYPAGYPLKKGGYVGGSLYDLVDRRLQELGEYAQNAFSRSSRKRKSVRDREKARRSSDEQRSGTGERSDEQTSAR